MNAIIIENAYYITPQKQQFREASSFLKEHYKGEPVVVNVKEVYGYYFKQINFQLPVENYKSLNDTLIMPQHHEFWTVEGHFMNILPWATEQELLKSYDKVQEFNGIGVWVKKFKRRS